MTYVVIIADLLPQELNYNMKHDQFSIAEVALDTPLRRTFDYLIPTNLTNSALKPGLRVKVPFGRRTLIGLIVRLKSTSSLATSRLKSLLEQIDDKPLLDSQLLALLNWACHYYHHPVGEVYAAALTPQLRKGAIHTKDKNLNTSVQLKEMALQANPDQVQALQIIKQSRQTFSVFLLEGITGSGKTEVYLQSIEPLLMQGKQILILIPEIALSPQTIARFSQRFDTLVSVLHSNLTEKQRTQSWLAAQSGMARIIIGTRSAVFTPCPHLGMIIVDEEHDPSFKQFEGFRYSARDVALKRAQLCNIPIILGSATPSLESLHNIQRNQYKHLLLHNRAGCATRPKLQLIDIKQQTLTQGFCPDVIKLIQHHLAQKQQVLLFLNRRGFAPLLTCHACGWIAQCKRCDAQLTWHQESASLRCHHCQASYTKPDSCPECNELQLIPIGAGTERVADTLSSLFPQTPIIRIDSDTTKKRGSLQEKLMAIKQQQATLLVGTQMLAKGHHFPNLSLVVILDADSGLYSIDFRAEERMSQLLLQVAGRAGRVTQQGQVIIQTRHPEHPLLQAIVAQNYQDIAQYCLNQRQSSALPPFSHLALIRAQAQKPQLAMNFLTEVRALAETLPLINSIQLLGPIPALMTKRAGYYRAQLLLSAKQRQHLHPFIDQLLQAIDTLKTRNQVRWSLDIDPIETL